MGSTMVATTKKSGHRKQTEEQAARAEQSKAKHSDEPRFSIHSENRSYIPARPRQLGWDEDLIRETEFEETDK